MTSKLNFRARTLDASKAMSVYYAEDLPELTDLNAINRSVPAMPSGMEKEEEAEKHLQDILVSQERPEKIKDKKKDCLVIPTPEVFVAHDQDGTYNDLYKSHFKLPRAFIHVQPFSVDQDLPDYDLDDEDGEFMEKTLKKSKGFEVDEIILEQMLDRLEKNSGHSAVSIRDAKMLLKQDDDLILAVYDYWVDKRLRLKQPLLPTVKSDKRETTGTSNSSSTSNSGSSNPYIAFRRRTEKMQTRKNRKNDEASYEKMLKLRRDLSRAVTLLEMVKRREKTKKESLNLTMDIFEKRYAASDFDGKIISDVLAQRQQPPHRVLQQQSYMNMKYTDNWLQQNQNVHPHLFAAAEAQRQKRSYNKKKRHRSTQQQKTSRGLGLGAPLSSDDDRSVSGASPSDIEEEETEGAFSFRRKRNCQYLAPLIDEDSGFELHRGWPWDALEDGGSGDVKFKYSLASLSNPKPRCLGMVRRRVGRGGRIVLDRAFANFDDLWRSLDFSVTNGCGTGVEFNRNTQSVQEQDDVNCNNLVKYPHYRPVTPPPCREEPDYDPYKPRLSETPFGLPTQPIKPPVNRGRVGPAMNGLGLKTVSVDSIIAQNAASAVVTNDTLDLFNSNQS